MDNQKVDEVNKLTESEVHRPGMQWYVVHTLTGQENKALKFIKAQKANVELQNAIGMVLMPTERVTEVRNKKRSTTVRKFFPGYLLVQAAVYIVPNPEKPHKRVLNTECWRFIKDTPGVIGFLGNDHPVPLSKKEIDDIVFQAEDTMDKARLKVDYNVDDPVTILEGPFKGSAGIITTVDADSGKLKVSVTIFGRPIDVDCEYWQVERQQEQTPAPGARN